MSVSKIKKASNFKVEQLDVLKEISTGVAQLDSGKGISHKRVLKRIEFFKKKWK